MSFVIRHQRLVAFIGFGGCRYLKQEQRYWWSGDVGNFINSSYFDAEQTLRHAIREDGEPLQVLRNF